MVTVAGKDMNPVVGSRGIRKLPNMTTKEAMRCGPWDCIVLIGGQFAWKPLAECKDVGILLREQEKAGRLIASVCTGIHTQSTIIYCTSKVIFVFLVKRFFFSLLFSYFIFFSSILLFYLILFSSLILFDSPLFSYFI